MPATISVDPEVWETFKKNCETVFHDDHWSPHLETLIRAENARLSGADPTAAAVEVDESQLRRRLINLTTEATSILDAMSKPARDALEKLTDAYGLDWENYANSEDVIRNMLLDYSREGSAVRDFLKRQGSLTSFNLNIQFIRVCAEKHKANLELVNAQIKQAKITPEEAAKTPIHAEEGKRKKKHPDGVATCIQCGYWPAEEAAEYHARQIKRPGQFVGGIRCDAGEACLSTAGKDEACEKAIPIGAPRQYPHREKIDLGSCHGRRGCRAKPFQLVYIGEERSPIRMCDDCVDRFWAIHRRIWEENGRILSYKVRDDEVLAQLRSEDTDESTYEQEHAQTTLPQIKDDNEEKENEWAND